MSRQGKIAIVGGAASGKDYLRKRMMDRGFIYGVSCTTRPPRKKAGEVHGKDYYFVTEDEFDKLIEDNQLVEWQEFNGWRYGITVEEFNRCDVMILNAEAVEMLSDEYRQRLFIIYLDIEESVRLDRIVDRNDPDDNYMRRIKADTQQFRNFSNFDCKITNPNF